MSSPLDIATGRIDIDLGALVRNYAQLQSCAGSADCAANVKADAYGHGVDHVVPALAAAGCRRFFVATPHEGARVRALAADTTIYVLDGLLAGQTAFYLEHNLTPVLGSCEETAEWSAATEAPAALHIDTGMNRLGMSPKDLETFLAGKAGHPKIALVMTHLACGDTPEHALNEHQITAFGKLRERFPDARASLGNSAATLLGWGRDYDVVRPGIALYGGRAIDGRDNSMEPVARLHARILKLRSDWNVPTIGYGATRSLDTVRRVATVAIGYADGLPRTLSAGDGVAEAHVWCAGHRVPIIGRVSMDLITIDVSSLPDDAVQRGDMVEILGPHIAVDELADRAGTIGYELLTQLSQRFPRVAITTERTD